MLRKQSTQKDFFDSYVYERLLPKEHILLDIRQNLDFSFIDEETKSFYSDDTRGRPPFAAQIIFSTPRISRQMRRFREQLTF